MIWNPWKHVRIAGALVAILGFVLHRLEVSILGLMVQYLGVVAGLDLTERRIAALEEAKQCDDKNGSN